MYSVKTEDSFAIYESTSHTLFWISTAATISAVMGAAFLVAAYDGSEISAFKYFGFLFLGTAGLIVFEVPKIRRRLKLNGGHLVFLADKEGLRVSPFVTSDLPMQYRWDQIEKICVTETFFERDSDGSFERRNCILIFFGAGISEAEYFKNILSHRSRSPIGQLYTAIPFPKEDLAASVRDKLHQFAAGRIGLELSKEVRFDGIAKSQKTE